MPALRHICLFLFYACLAAGAAIGLPAVAPLLETSLVVICVVSILLLGVVLHEAVTRISREDGLMARILELQEAQDSLESELSGARREAGALREALEAAARSKRFDEGGSEAVSDVLREVNMLRSLVENLTANAQPRRPAKSQAPVSKVDRKALPAAGLEPEDFLPPRVPLRSSQKVKHLGKAEENSDNSSSLKSLDDDRTLELVRRALRDDRIDLLLQPVVSLPQRKRRFYECFSRLRTDDDRIILPDQYIALAEREHLIGTIDNMLLLRCMQMVRRIQHQDKDVGFFCNISAHSLRDQAFFNDFLIFLENNADLAPHLIFEFSQSDFLRQGRDERRLLKRMMRLGCRIALDQVTDLDIDFRELERLQVSFIKIAASKLLSRPKPGGPIILSVLRKNLRGHPVELIAEKVEDEASLVEMLDYDLKFAQGFLFSQPRLARLLS